MACMQKRWFHGFIAGCLLLNTPLSGQQLNFRTFTNKEGLTTYNISNTTQDKYGFIWVATQDGLFRFNGTNFQVFRNTKGGKSSPMGNVFLNAAYNNNESIYASDYMYGFDIFNISNLTVLNIGQDSLKNIGLPDYWIWDILFDDVQNEWLRGINYFAFKRHNDRRYTVIKKISGHPGDFAPSFIKPFGKEHIAIGIPDYGTIIYDKISLKMTGIIRNFTPGSPAIDNIKDIILAGDSIILATNNSLITGVYENNQWYFGKQFKDPELSNTVINSIVCDKRGYIWTGTGNGLFQFLPKEEKFIHYQVIPGKTRWLADNTIRHLMIDRQDNLWISTSSVLQMVNINGNGFTAFDGTGNGSDPIDHIYTLCEKNEKEVFATGTNGLYEVNILNGMSKKIPGTETLGYLHHIEKLEDDLWLLSAENGIYAYSPSSGKISQQLLLKLFPEWLPFKKNYFNTSYRINDTWYWASEESEGLIKWDKKAHHISQFKAGTAGSHGLPENHLRNLKTDRQGFLWILSDETVTQFDVRNDSVISVLRHSEQALNSSIIFDLYDDGKTLWFATYGGGVNGYDKRRKTWTYITESSGLTNNAVYGILPENDTVIWATTNFGVTRINTSSFKCTGYFYEDGLQDNFFDEKGVLKSGNRLYFGGIKGFTCLDLAQFHNTDYSFPVYIHQVDYYSGSKRTEINRLEWDRLTLPPGAGPINIHLSSLLFAGNNHVSFSYRVPGVINDFISVPDNNIISLSGLSHGSYNIQIRHRKKDGTYADSELTLHIYIKPRWYQTWWFKTLMLLGVITLAYGLYRMRINQLKKEEKIRNQLASDLHDDLGSTLNSIKVHSNLALLEREKPEHLEHVKQGAQDAISGVRDIIWVLDDKKDTVNDMLARISQFAAPVCRAANVSYNVLEEKEATELKLGKEEKRNLYMICKESINNSIKYAGCKSIQLKIAADGTKLTLTISDDGQGFDKEKITAGNGLKNIAARAKAIHYSCIINSETGKGTTIVLIKD